MASSPDIALRVAQLREQQKLALSALSQRSAVSQPGVLGSTVSLPATPSFHATASALPSPPSSLEDARHLSLLLAKMRVHEAQAELERAEYRMTFPDPAYPGEEGLVKALAAVRVRAVLFAQHEACLRTAMRDWHTASLLALIDVGNPNALKRSQLEFMEDVLIRLQPSALAWAMRAWVRAVTEMEREQARASRLSTIQHGKWALQRAFSVEQQTRERLTHSILRWWLHGELAQSWRKWREACMMMHTKRR